MEMDDYIELVPFAHQVGGHSFMLSLDEKTVCKVLVPRELNFYQTLPEAVQKFTPKYHCIVTVHTIQDEEGYIKFLAKQPISYKPTSYPDKKIRLKRTGSFEVTTNEPLYSEDSLKSAINPWVLKCHQENDLLRTMDYIALENLVYRFRYPCILDLKMGTRQYGDAVSLTKKQSKMVKVVTTTSAKLGLRVGGMQVYQVSTKQYLCKNKFYGRTLTVSGFQSTLYNFFHNGIRFRYEVLPVIIKKLEDLAHVISKQESIRFYTSSLLLIYDGHDTFTDSDGIIELPDSKLCRQDSFGGSDSDLYHSKEPMRKTGTRRRRSSVLNVDTAVLSDSSLASSNSSIFEDCVHYLEKTVKRSRKFSTKCEEIDRPTTPVVDVRMIDFAHSTHKALDDPVVYSGPDKGFLFGLDRLIDMLKEMENDY